ncbi:L-2-haloalkanoic acid dehalogenase [Nostoc minutum NIES-26]|uniref:L-2-haloalkanoic acid dehalogenase n=1 Tax=Nostoc minutum NIES-26 TaxID=1844469 RepID=A0A367S169_9NOSO|nr:L-2-haloalkanoic acid dehalogenase [Nostoc minutum NIES-26]
MFKAILFDLDGTLLDRDSSIKHFVSTQYDRFAPKFKNIRKSDYISRFIELDCRGYVWKDKVYQSMISDFGVQTITWEELLDDYYVEFINSCIPFPNLLKTLDILTKQGYRLGIITNGLGDFQRRTIQGLGIENYFQTTLISEIEGVRKPEAEIFIRALRSLGVMANESIFIGDRPDVDVMGAKHIGMKSIWKRDLGWREPENADGIIDDLGEIPLIIERFL